MTDSGELRGAADGQQFPAPDRAVEAIARAVIGHGDDRGVQASVVGQE